MSSKVGSLKTKERRKTRPARRGVAANPPPDAEPAMAKREAGREPGPPGWLCSNPWGWLLAGISQHIPITPAAKSH